MTSKQAGIILQHIRRIAGKTSVAQPPDAQLLARFSAEHDEAAFATLVRRHGPMVLNVCRTVLHHEQDAEDAFQATFLVLARKAESIRQPEAVAGWLYEVAYHVAVKAQAETARRRAQERKVMPMPPADPTLDMTLRDLRRVLHEELRRLPDKYRVPLVLCYLEGRSQEEAADQLGWSKGTFPWSAGSGPRTPAPPVGIAWRGSVRASVRHGSRLATRRWGIAGFGRPRNCPVHGGRGSPGRFLGAGIRSGGRSDPSHVAILC